MHTKRLFLAIPVPLNQDLQNAIYEFQSELKDEKIKWVSLSAVHITLKFFGDTPVEMINKINDMVCNSKSQTNTFQLKIYNFGVFPNIRRPKVLWVGIEKPEELSKLWHEVNKGAETIGFESEKRKFSPHLTIGRIKHLQRNSDFQEKLQAFQNRYSQTEQTITVDHINLYESILKPSGAVYKIIQKFEL